MKITRIAVIAGIAVALGAAGVGTASAERIAVPDPLGSASGMVLPYPFYVEGSAPFVGEICSAVGVYSGNHLRCTFMGGGAPSRWVEFVPGVQGG